MKDHEEIINEISKLSHESEQELKIKVKSIILKKEENESPYIQIKYDFFQIYKNSNE